VKVRTGDFASGAEAVTPYKQQRIRQALGCYLMEHPEYETFYIRYDVCQITGDMETQHPELDYFENAFY
jgi:Holliday junction resolvase-like predicted endonuclease